MRYLTTNSHISPTKEQIKFALMKMRRAADLYIVIDKRLETETVEVKSWFGLRRKVMTKDQHIRKVNKNSFIPYHTRAMGMGYITIEELRICRFVMNSPTIQKLQQWEGAECVYLGEFDHNELTYALTQEFE